MNRTENVSIGRIGFVCDKDAYALLKAYLERCELALKDDPDRTEILADLESSMAGHLSELSGELVVDKETALKVVAIMGEVDAEYGSGQADSGHGPDSDANGDADGEDLWSRVRRALKKPIKKDRSRAIGDGICAGIAKSIDVDPLWVRLVFVVLAIATQGAFVGVYIILSFIMKEDRSVPKRRASEVVDDIKARLSSGERASVKEYEKVARSIVVGLVKFVWAVLKIIVCTILVIVSMAWISILLFMLTNPSQVDVFGGSPGWLGFTAVFSAGLLLLIPLFELLLSLFGRAKTKSALTVTLWSVWALALIICAGSFANLVPNIRQYLVTQKPKNDFVYVQMAGNDIASLCISPLGTCSDTEQLLTNEPLCGRNVTIYDRDDRYVWLGRQWGMTDESFAYPVDEAVYCKRIVELYDMYGSRGGIMFARQTLNAREDVGMYQVVQDQAVPNTMIPSDREYWHLEYLVKY